MAGYTNGIPVDYIYINCTIEQMVAMFNKLKNSKRIEYYGNTKD